MAKKDKPLEDLTPIELFSPSRENKNEGCGKRSFKIDHAQKILNLDNDWELVDKKIKFENGVIIRPSTGAAQISA